MTWCEGRTTVVTPSKREHHEHVDRHRVPGRDHRNGRRGQGRGAGQGADHPAGRHRRDVVLAFLVPADHGDGGRDKEGKYHVTTNHNPVAGGTTWGMFWGLLFGMLFFVPFL